MLLERAARGRSASDVNKNKDSFSNASMIVIVLALVITIASIVAYRILVQDMVQTAPVQNERYAYHFALITDAYDDPFWDAVWKAANQKAMNNDAYVEWLGRGLEVSYAPAELMEIAVSAKVDGILVRADGSDELYSAIQRASELGIPVITVMTDAIDSGRQGYVGYNSYELGHLYGEQLLKHLPEDGSAVTAMMLLNDEPANSGWNIVYSSVMETIGSRNASLEIKNFNNSSVFSVEEEIRELVMREETAPDVLLCMDPITTMCAYQAVVDYNRVGKVAIVGNYITDQTLSALQKDIIQATITVDSDMVGETGTDALLECMQYGRASDYATVNLIVITPDDVDEYISAREAAEETADD